jgi:hypothetical protein
LAAFLIFLVAFPLEGHPCAGKVEKAELIIKNQQPWADKNLTTHGIDLKGCGFYNLQPFVFFVS